MAPPPRFRPGRDRAALLADLPRGYNPYLHVAVPNLFGALVIGLCLLALDGPTLLQWLVVPAVIVVSFAAEWRFHRDLLHRRVHPFTALYDYHTVSHHSVYQRGDMAIREPRELRGILFPIWAIFFVYSTKGTNHHSTFLSHFARTKHINRKQIPHHTNHYTFSSFNDVRSNDSKEK